MANEAEDHRQQRQQDDADHQQRQVLLDERHVAEEVAQGHQAADPGHGADHAEHDEARVVHLRHAGDEGREGPHDGQEARQGHGLAAVAFVELMGAVEVVAAEYLRVGVAEQPLAEGPADHVVGAVAGDRRDHQQPAEQPWVHAAGGADGAGDEQQRVAGEERSHHQAGFTEDHQEQDGVDPDACLGLAIAQSIVALHGGYIYAKSDQKWTSFIIHLPLQRTNKKSES